MYVVPLAPFVPPRSWQTITVDGTGPSARQEAASVLFELDRTRHDWANATHVASAFLPEGAGTSTVHMLGEGDRTLAAVIERSISVSDQDGRVRSVLVLDLLARPDAFAHWDVAQRVAGIAVRRRLAGDRVVAVRTRWAEAAAFAGYLFRSGSPEAPVETGVATHPAGAALRANQPGQLAGHGVQLHIQELPLTGCMTAWLRAEFAPDLDPTRAGPTGSDRVPAGWDTDEALAARALFIPMAY